LGLRDLRTLNLKSEGDVLSKGSIDLNNDEIPVVVKFFRVPCPYITIIHGNKTIHRIRNIDDKNQYEIGNTLFLTDTILLNERYLTHHITFAFASRTCTSAYETQTSMCNSNFVIEPNNFLIPSDCNGKFVTHPQCAFQSDYMNHVLSDTVRYLVVEMANGDLERWIYEEMQEPDFSINDFDYKLSSILIMIAFTLYVLDDYLHGFVHGDLGPRNVLYSECRCSDKYWKYQIKELQPFYIKTCGIVPKLWDFSTTHINNINPKYIPENTNREASYFKEDLTILFNKISDILKEKNMQCLQIFNAIQDILPYSQQMSNCEITLKFLSHDIIVKNFCNIGITNYMIEDTFHYI
jgi:hypothetical protein